MDKNMEKSVDVREKMQWWNVIQLIQLNLKKNYYNFFLTISTSGTFISKFWWKKSEKTQLWDINLQMQKIK